MLKKGYKNTGGLPVRFIGQDHDKPAFKTKGVSKDENLRPLVKAAPNA